MHEGVKLSLATGELAPQLFVFVKQLFVLGVDEVRGVLEEFEFFGPVEFLFEGLAAFLSFLQAAFFELCAEFAEFLVEALQQAAFFQFELTLAFRLERFYVVKHLLVYFLNHFN